MLRVGLTGGIGSGKSLVTDILKQLSIPVYHADDRSKLLLDTSPDLREQLILIFGTGIYKADKIDRAGFANTIFSSREQLEKANRIIHPFVFADFNHWSNQQSNVPYIVMEAAVLFESGAQQILDYTITLLADEKIRVRRVMERDKVDHDSVVKRMRYQLTDVKRQALADSILINNDKELLIPQVLKLHEFLLGLSGKNRTNFNG